MQFRSIKVIGICSRGGSLMFLVIALLLADDIHAIWYNTRGAKDGWARR